MNKRIMALAVVIALLVAVCPITAMADSFTINSCEQNLTLTAGEKSQSVVFNCNDFIPNGAELRYEGYDDTIVEVTTGVFTSATEGFVVLVKGLSAGVTQVTVAVYQDSICVASDVVSVTVEAPDEEIETITVEMANPVYGQNVMSTSCTVSAVPTDSVKVKEEHWEKYLAGTDPDLGEDVTDPEDVFQEGYEYFYSVTFEIEEGYTVTEDTECTFNGNNELICMQGNVVILEEDFTPSEAPTVTPTAKPTDNPKTGDFNNMWLYAFAVVVALGMIGGVVLKKKADR